MSSVSASPDHGPCRTGTRLDSDTYAVVRRRAVFDCCKWDVQYEDVATLAPFPLLLAREAWRQLTDTAAALARETRAVEAELAQRPELHARLGLPRGIRSALRRCGTNGPSAGLARVIRFDFHLTTEGWRISEANTDVPGGFNEASGLCALMAEQYSDVETAGDPAGAYADALIAGTRPGARIALVHATAYSDDHQVMRYLAQHLERRGAVPILVSPAHIGWNSGYAFLTAAWDKGPLDALVRFFPAEWLPNLGWRSGWQTFFSGARTPASNPATTLLSQTKRLPLVWDELRTELPTWRRMLPETCDHRAVPWGCRGDWVLKPALGRVGEGVGLTGVTTDKEWQRIRRDLFWHRGAWVAQRRFIATPLMTAEGLRYACIGVFTVDERVVGAYGRLATVPLIDARAQDIAILVERHA